MGGNGYSFVQNKKPVPIGVALAQVLENPHDPVPEKTITVGGDKVKGMNGTEEVYGSAIVGGNNVKFESQDDAPQFMFVNGEKVAFPTLEDEPAKNTTATVQKKNWTTNNDDGDEDEEVRRMRMEMKNGVLAYDNYMDHKLNRV